MIALARSRPTPPPPAPAPPRRHGHEPKRKVRPRGVVLVCSVRLHETDDTLMRGAKRTFFE